MNKTVPNMFKMTTLKSKEGENKRNNIPRLFNTEET